MGVGALTPYGDLITVRILAKPSPQGSLSGFVRFASRQEAELAFAGINAGQVKLGGIVICARWAKENSRPTVGMAALKAQAQMHAQAPAAQQLDLASVLQAQ